MKILFISPQIPYPYIGGAKMVTYNTIKYLAKNGVDITLLALETFSDREGIYELGKYCTVKTVFIKKNNYFLQIIKNLFSSKPYSVNKYFIPLVFNEIDFILKNNDIQLVHVERLHMAYCAKYIKGKYSLPIIFRPHNVESSILLGYLKYATGFWFKKYLKIQYERLYEYEKNIIQYFDKCLAISDFDRDVFLNMSDGIDCSVIAPGINVDMAPKSRIAACDILFVGSLDWKPNEDSLLWFVHDVFPIIRKKKEIKFIIIGKNPPPGIKSLNDIEGIEVKGFVDNVEKYYAAASVAIAPLQYGGGVKIKIIESMLMKVPLVVTDIGIEGMDCIHQEHLLIAKNKYEFADAVISLLQNKDKANNIVENGYEFAKKKYNPIKVAKKYIDIYGNLVRK